MTESSEPTRPPAPSIRRSRLIAAVGAALVAAVVLVVVVALASGDDSEESGPSTTVGGVALPQNPSLAVVERDGSWFVVNDGNVTMSGVVLRDGDELVCELGTISPADRATCDGATALTDPNTFGRGPQGQEVSVEG